MQQIKTYGKATLEQKFYRLFNKKEDYKPVGQYYKVNNSEEEQ